uniref:Transmembrane protein n=1 Tax=Strongyloides stercoralis TaxID=6248 RepID=A0A0K0ED43_STRER
MVFFLSKKMGVTMFQDFIKGMHKVYNFLRTPIIHFCFMYSFYGKANKYELRIFISQRRYFLYFFTRFQCSIIVHINKYKYVLMCFVYLYKIYHLLFYTNTSIILFLHVFFHLYINLLISDKIIKCLYITNLKKKTI